MPFCRRSSRQWLEGHLGKDVANSEDGLRMRDSVMECAAAWRFPKALPNLDHSYSPNPKLKAAQSPALQNLSGVFGGS